jgi:hypothetical protein
VLCGHSLGGSLATLAALDLSKNPVRSKNPDGKAPKLRVITFGAPHVGDGNFVRLVEAAAECVRVVNPFDPVPKALAGQLLHAGDAYSVASLTRDSPLTAHSLSTYALALERPRWLQVLGLFAPATYVLLAGGGVVAFHALRRG